MSTKTVIICSYTFVSFCKHFVFPVLLWGTLKSGVSKCYVLYIGLVDGHGV